MTVNSALSVSISPTSATYDTGQSVSLTATASGGTSPYTYQWYNDTSGTGISISGATSATFTEPAGATAQTVIYYVKVTDSASSTTTSSTESYVINTALGTPTISPASGTYSSGQTITLTAAVSGGTVPYYYQWYNDTSGTANAISGAISSIFTEPAGATAQTVKYYVTVTDSATTNEIENSPTADISISSSSSPPSSPPPSSSSSSSSSSSGSGGIVGNSTNINYPGTRPQMTSINNGFVIFGIAPLTAFNLTLFGTKLDFVENFITTATAGITVNGKNYVLYPNQSKTIFEISGEPYRYNMSIYNLSNTPVKSTIALKVIAISNLEPINITGQNATYDIITYNSLPVQLNLLSEKTTVNITSAFTAKQQFAIRNLTFAKYLPPLPQGYSKILVQNISVKGLNYQNTTAINTTMTITMRYNCSIPFYKIFPFILSNSSWKQFTQFTVNSKSCTVALTSGGDPIIALGKYTVSSNSTTIRNISKISNHTIPLINRNISTHIVTINPSVVNNTITSGYLQYNTYEYILLAIFIAIVLLSVYYYLHIKGKYSVEKPKSPHSHSSDSRTTFPTKPKPKK